MTAQCQVLGRLGRDVEIKQTQAGGAIAFGSVAVDQGWGDKKKTIWWQVKCFGKTAENFAKAGKKGMLVFAAGEFDLNEYQAKDGTQKTSPSVNATNISWYNIEQAQKHEEAFAKNSAPTSASPSYGAATSYGTQPNATQPRQAQGVAPTRTDDVPF